MSEGSGELSGAPSRAQSPEGSAQPHTAGPWTACDAMVVVTHHTHGYDTAIADYRIGGSTRAEQCANARVGAAAPKLLDALERLTQVIRMAGLNNLANGVQLGQTSWFVKASDAMDDADDAIAKATGQ